MTVEFLDGQSQVTAVRGACCAGCAQPEVRAAADDHRPAGKRRRFSGCRPAGAADCGGRVSRGIAAGRDVVWRRKPAGAAIRPCASRLVLKFFGVAAARPVRTCRSRPCRAVDQRKRSRFAARAADGARQRGAAVDGARHAPVPRADVAERYELGRRGRGQSPPGRKRSFPACPAATRHRSYGKRSRGCAASMLRIPSPRGRRISATSQREASGSRRSNIQR